MQLCGLQTPIREIRPTLLVGGQRTGRDSSLDPVWSETSFLLDTLDLQQPRRSNLPTASLTDRMLTDQAPDPQCQGSLVQPTIAIYSRLADSGPFFAYGDRAFLDPGSAQQYVGGSSLRAMVSTTMLKKYGGSQSLLHSHCSLDKTPLTPSMTETREGQEKT